MKVLKLIKFLCVLFGITGWSSIYGQTGFTEDFNDNTLSNDWTGSAQYSLTEMNQELSVATVTTAGGYYVFTYTFAAMDFSGSPYLKIKAKSSANFKLRIDFEDINGRSTNSSPLNLDVAGNNTYQSLTYNFIGRFNQSWPSAATVDPTQIVKVVIFVNPGSAAFNGTIYLDDLIVGSDTGILPPPGDIKLNQLGFYPNAPKFAVAVTSSAGPFYVLSEDLQDTVFTGTLGASASFALTGETVRKADFTNFNATGKYYLNVPGLGNSHLFEIKPNVHHAVSKAGIKGFYYQRASTALLSAHAGPWARPKGHADNNVMVHNSAANPYNRPAGTIISSPGGWYDAGDYNKYIINAGVTTFMLMSMYEHYPSYFDTLDLNIPESGNSIPDVLDEILWEIRWILTMQDPFDGGVYSKLTTANFGGTVMPASNTAQRYVVKKTTASALDFSATLAQAARIFKLYEAQLPGLADSCINASVKAWKWARRNPNQQYVQSLLTDPEINTGEYGDSNFSDELQWAAMELYGTTRIDSFYTLAGALASSINPPGWQDVRSLGYMSLSHLRKSLGSIADTTGLKSKLTGQASYLRGQAASNPYGTSMNQNWNFSWGGNSQAATHGVVLLQAFDLTKDSSYFKAAIADLDYLMGRNGVNYSFVTGYGSVSPMYIHHRISSADGVADPIPGLLVGGPHTDALNDCGSSAYPSTLKGKAYLDAQCSYSTNEIAINWNAPFAYLSNIIEAIESGASVEHLNYQVVLPTNIALVSETLTSVSENSQPETGLFVYPNPARDKLVVEYTSAGNAIITLTDVRGTKVIERESAKTGEQSEQLELSGLNKGLYYLILKSGNKTEARKVMIE